LRPALPAAPGSSKEPLRPGPRRIRVDIESRDGRAILGRPGSRLLALTVGPIENAAGFAWVAPSIERARTHGVYE